MSSVRSVHSRLWRFFTPGGRCGAWATRCKQAAAKKAAVEKALKVSVSTSRSALQEVERLRSAKEMLEATASERMLDLVESRRTIQRLEEERDHLRADADELLQRVCELQKSMDADTQSVLDENWQLVRDLRASNHQILREQDKRQRLIAWIRASRSVKRLSIKLLGFLRSAIVRPFKALTAGLACACRWSCRKLGWLTLIPLFGRTGATEIQEALNHG